jgi:magnesium-transporting ATPase (P-type)
MLLAYIFYMITGGFGWLLFYWKPDWKLKITCYMVPLDEAEFILTQRASGGSDVETVMLSELPEGGMEDAGSNDDSDERALLAGNGEQQGGGFVRYFLHRNLRYIYDKRVQYYRRVVAFDQNTTIKRLHTVGKQPPPMGEARSCLTLLHGKNEIDVPIKPYFTIFVEEVLDPFYIFQLFAVLLWAYEFYIYYAVCIVLISGMSITINLRETRRNLTNLHNMVKFSGTVPFCHRGLSGGEDDVTEVDSTELLPGDIFQIPSDGMMLSCDAVLLVGGVVVNESMLTGESVPVTKVPLPAAEDSTEHSTYSIEVHKSHTLFCGTHIIQTRAEIVRAMVIRTGFSTAKGQLVRSILFPRPTRFDLSCA